MGDGGGFRDTDVPPFDVKHYYYDIPHNVQGGAKVKHRVILVRHGESLHNKRHDGRGCARTAEATAPCLDTSLTDDGISQSQEVGEYLASKDWHPDVIRVSPMTRTRQTASPYMYRTFPTDSLDEFSRAVKESTENGGTACVTLKANDGKETIVMQDTQCMEVNTWADQDLVLDGCRTKRETYKQFVDRVRRWKKTLEQDAYTAPTGRIQTLVFTHSMVISEFLNLLVTEKRDDVGDGYGSESWSKTYWQVNHGSITCVDYMDNGEWHIHAMNYMDHITTRTGVKAPFV